MKARVITGLVAALFVVGLIFYAPAKLILAVVMICTAMAFIELEQMIFKAKDIRRRLRISCLLTLCIVTLYVSPEHGWIAWWSSFAYLGCYHIIYWNKDGNFEKGFNHFCLELFTIAYLTSIFGFLLPVINLPQGNRHLLFLLFWIVFGGDTFAYFTGKLFGKHTLAAKLSPKKSLEGSMGGLIAAVLGSFIYLKYAYPYSLTYSQQWALLLFVPALNIIAQMGDLFESLLKRSQSCKDSGTVLPGHGGILDRVDGLAFATPIFYFFIASLHL